MLGEKGLIDKFPDYVARNVKRIPQVNLEDSETLRNGKDVRRTGNKNDKNGRVSAGDLMKNNLHISQQFPPLTNPSVAEVCEGKSTKMSDVLLKKIHKMVRLKLMASGIEISM